MSEEKNLQDFSGANFQKKKNSCNKTMSGEVDAMVKIAQLDEQTTLFLKSVLEFDQLIERGVLWQQWDKMEKQWEVLTKERREFVREKEELDRRERELAKKVDEIENRAILKNEVLELVKKWVEFQKKAPSQLQLAGKNISKNKMVPPQLDILRIDWKLKKS